MRKNSHEGTKPVRIIHQTWKDEQPADPPFRERWVTSWQELNPSWNYCLWTDLDIKSFVRYNFPEFFPFWCAYPSQIMRVDAWRYLLLKKIGGLYVDLDFCCLKPIENWLPLTELFVCAKQDKCILNNSIMWSAYPDTKFLDDVEVELVNRVGMVNVLNATGPHFLTDYSQSRSAFFYELQPEVVFPIKFYDDNRESLGKESLDTLREKFPQAGAVTFWTNSWANQPLQIVNPDDNICIRRARLAFLIIDKSSDEILLSDDNVLEFLEPGDIPGKFCNFEYLGGDLDFSNIKEPLWLFVCDERCYFDYDRFFDVSYPNSDIIVSHSTRGVQGIDGTTGYLISPRVVNLLKARNLIVSNLRHGEIDQKIRHLVGQFGLSIEPSPYIRSDNSIYPRRGNHIISCAGCSREQKMVFRTLLHAPPVRNVKVAHRDWLGELSFYENGLFELLEQSKYGHWQEDIDKGIVILNWFDRELEILVPMNTGTGDFSGNALIISRRSFEYLMI